MFSVAAIGFLIWYEGRKPSKQHGDTHEVAAHGEAAAAKHEQRHGGGGEPAVGRSAGSSVEERAPKAERPRSTAAAAEPARRSATAHTLTITSRPKGARVYVDGTEHGRTPVRLEASDDKHALALIRPGYALHLEEIPGRGEVAVRLKPVSPLTGTGGIRVRCKRKHRYYVFVDGRDVGQLCPTKRIRVRRGRHVVEIYDPVTQKRRSFHVKVRGTRYSVRVQVD